ncbi:hypothetical protein OFB92_36040, partial [Escherichia coli]|nr:hypothetical protein [Escherichia coli]
GDKVWVKLIGREMKNDRIKVSLKRKRKKRKQRQKALRNLIPQRILPGRERRKRRRRNIETGSRLTVIALTLRVTRARRR